MANADVFGKKDEQTQSGFEGSGSRIASVLSMQKIASGNGSKPIPKVGTYTVRLGGKDYSLSTQQAAWIKQRYSADAKTLTPDAVQSTYTGSRLDSQLKEVGLPSSKYILDYMSAYDEWYGDGTTYTFSKDAQKSIGEKFKSTWQYDYTVEDQRRKKQGLAPVKVAAKYADSYADSQLLAMGLPPSSDLGKYVEEYDTVLNETAKVNYLYDLVTAKIMDKERELGGYAQLDDTARMAIFDEVYASSEFDDIRHLYKEPAAISSDGTVDSSDEYLAKWAAMGKKSAASDEPVISWSDFTAGYQKRKSDMLVKNAAYSEDIEDAQKATTAGLKNKDDVQQYIKSRGTDKAVDILADMFEARLPIGRIREAKNYLLGLATTEEEKKAIRTSVREIANAYTREHYSASENADKFKTSSERKAEREAKRLGDSTVKNGAVKQYDAGMTSAITVDVAEEIFNSHLVYGDDGKPTKESIALATNMLYEAGATTPIVLEVGKRAGMKNGILSKDYADTQKESLQAAMTASAEAMTSGVTPITNDESPNDLTAYNSTFATVVSERDLKQRKELMDASYQANVESGKMTRAEFYNAVRRAGWSDTIDIEKQAEVYYDEVYAPKFKENGEVLPSWEEIDQAAFTEYFANEKDLDPEIHKTTEEIVRGSLQRTFTSGVFEAISGAVSVADMATAKASGRTDTWEFTKRANEAARASEGVTSSQSFGSQVANVASTVAGQYTRMMIMSEIGSGVLSMFSKPAAAIGQALARTNAGNILSSLSSNVPAVSKGISAIVKGSKWAIQSTPFIATSMGSYYSEAIQGGASIEQAVPYATVCGLMEGAFEAVGTELWLGRMFGSQTVAKEIITAGRSVFKATSVYPKALLIRLVASTLGNALEEVGSYAVSIGMQKRTYNADAEFDWNEAAEQGLMGALIGLFGAGMNYSADTQLNILAEFFNSEAGQKWASEAGQSAVNDLMFMATIAETAPQQVITQKRLEDNGTSTDEVSATVRNIDQISRQMEDGQKKYDADMAKFDAELQAKKDALASIEGEMSRPSLSNKEYAKLGKRRTVALSELEVETAQVEAKRTERTKAFTEATEQHKIDRHKAQQKLLGMSISVMDAFSSDIVALGNLARNKVTTVPNEIGNMIIAKMDAARAGRLIDFMQKKNEIQQGIQYESVKFPNASTTAAEAAGAAQMPTGDNVVVFGQNSAEIAPVASETAQEAQVMQPASVETIAPRPRKTATKSGANLTAEERTVVDAFNSNASTEKYDWLAELNKSGVRTMDVTFVPGDIAANVNKLGDALFEITSDKQATEIKNGFVAVYEGGRLFLLPTRNGAKLYGGDFSTAYTYEDGKPAEQRMNLRDGERLVLVSPAELAWNHSDTPEQRKFDTEVLRMDLEAQKKDITGMRFFYVAKRGVIRIESTANTEPSAPSKPANVAMFDQARSTAGAKAVESLNDRAIEMERQPLSFSKEEMPFVDSAVKAVSSISAEVGTDIKAAFPYAKSIVGMDYVAESMQDIALRVLNGDAEYLDGENLTRQIERVIGTVRIDLVPTEVGLLGHDGAEIRDIRNQIRKTKISIGAYTATGFKYSVDDSIRTDKSLFGTIRLSKSGTAQSADALYYELSSAYPDLFDPEIVNPSDQIRVMADFVRMTYNGRAESLSKIKSGEYVYYLAHDVVERFVARTMDSYLGIASLRNENGGETDGEVGAVESATGIVAETRSGSTEETERNETGTGKNQGSAKVSQPQNPAEPMGAEATVSNKVGTDAKPSSETMGIVDPRLQEGVSALRKFGRAAYKRIVSGAAGTERASRVQKKLGIGGASIDSSAQGIRNARGTAQYILGDALVDINGTRIGRSLTELFKDIPQAKWADFQKYLLAKHTESRMTLEQRGYGKDKPVLASESGALDPDGNATAMDANEAAAIAAKLEAENPNFVAIRDSYRSWWSNFMRSWAVDGGLMTETQFNALEAKYPDYVPTYRVDKNSVGGASSATRNSVTVSSAIRNATGSTDEIQDIRISLSDMVKRYVTMERRNELVQNLFNFAETHTKAAAEFATIFDEESGFSPDVDFVSFDELANKDAAEVKDGQYIIRGFRDGERVSMHVSKDVYDAINYLTNPTDVSVRSQHENEILRGARTISKPIKGVITGYNPFFALMNFARDAQTYFVNTNAKAGDIFINIGRAVSERAKNSALWQSYLALGGNASGYITSQQMTDASVTGKGKVSNAVKKAGEIVGWLGGYTENMFRFAEYINGVNKYGDTAEGRRNAMADAADVTVNFSRSGAYTKAADAFCLYLNANVQGLDKMARTIANNPGRTALRGLSLAAIALLLRYVTDNDDNPHYQNLTNYVKDSSYCIPNVLGERDDNGYCTTFIKIPKSREYGTLIVATLERAARWADGSESFDDAFADLGKDIGTSIGIRMEPIWTAAQTITTKSPKNYFGSDIVPMYMQNEAAPDQTTAQTSIISDAISERLYDMGVEVSPMVMDYVINQYGGFYGQLLTSATAKDASGVMGVAKNIVTDKFVADPLYQSGAVSRFYDAMDDAQYFARQSKRKREALGIGTVSVDEQYYDALGDYQKQLAALRKEERAILAKEDDTPERKDKIDKIREEMNEVANAGLALWAKRGK